MKKCWSCAEEVQDDAVRCRYCGTDLVAGPKGTHTKRKTIGKGCLFIFLAVFGFVVLLAIVGGLSRQRVPPSGSSTSDTSPSSSGGITAAQYQSVSTGMSYTDVVAILGQPTEEMSRTEMAGVSTSAYSWKNYDGSNALIMFQNGKVVSKAQAGLR